jgi:hypothetical protein
VVPTTQIPISSGITPLPARHQSGHEIIDVDERAALQTDKFELAARSSRRSRRRTVGTADLNGDARVHEWQWHRHDGIGAFTGIETRAETGPVAAATIAIRKTIKDIPPGYKSPAFGRYYGRWMLFTSVLDR